MRTLSESNLKFIVVGPTVKVISSTSALLFVVFCRLGFAAEAYPRMIMPTELVLTTTGETKRLFDYVSTDQLYDQIVDFLQLVFFKYFIFTSALD